MKPDWDKLGDEYAGSSSVLIGDVDCTAEGQSLCEKTGISGYPTIKYFKDGNTEGGEDYQGGRDYDSLKKHVEDELEIKCFVTEPRTSGCDEKQIGYIEKMMMKGREEQTKQLDRLEGMKDQTMAPTNRQWLMQRINILKQFAEGGDEL